MFASRVALLTLAVLGLAASDAPAQDADVAPAAEKPAKPEVRAVPLEEVPARSEMLAKKLQTLIPSDEAKAEIPRLEQELETAMVRIGARLKNAQEALVGSPTVIGLQDLRVLLRGLEAPLDEMDGALARAGERTSDALDQLDHRRAVWRETRAAVDSAGASPGVLRRIDGNLTDIDAAREQVRAHRDAVLALSGRVVDGRAEIGRVQAEVGGALEERLGSVFSVSHPPLWRQDLAAEIRRELAAGWSEPIAERLTRVVEYVRASSGILGLQLALFAALSVGLSALGRRARSRTEEDYDLREAGQVFGLPVAMALIIALAVTPQLHPLSPRMFKLAMGTIAVVPAVIIVHRLTPQVMVPLILGVLVFFVADRVRVVLETLPVLERLIFLAEMVGALGFLIWLCRPHRLAALPPEARRRRFLRVVGVAMRVGIAVFAAALLADAVGLGDLSELIGNGMLRSAYTAIFMFALLKALQSIVAFALVMWPLNTLHLVSRHRWMLRRRLDRALLALVVVWWAALSLGYLNLLGPLIGAAQGALAAEFGVGALSISLGAVVVFGLTVWLSFLLARLLNFVLEEDVYPRLHLGRGVPYAVSALVRYTLLFIGFLFALAAGGIELGKLTVVAGGLGVGIGFGLQNVVNNFISGLILLFERPIEVGDVVQVQDLWGEVRRIGIRASVIRTWEGAEVVVPNGSLLAESVTNWTLSDRRRRVEVNVGVEYGTDAQRVIELLLGIAQAHADVLDDPPPRADFQAFGDSALEFRLRCWIADFDEGLRVRTELGVAVQRALAEAQIAIPFPQRDLHLKSVPPGAAPRVERN